MLLHVAWTISRPLDLHGCMAIGGVHGGGVLRDHPQTAAAVLDSMQLSRYQVVIDLEYSFVSGFRHQLICESQIFATYSAAGMGVGLYAGWLIGEFIQYMMHQ